MKTILLELPIEIGDIVYYKTDTMQLPWQVFRIHINPGYTLRYELSQGEKSSCAYDFELSKEKVAAML